MKAHAHDVADQLRRGPNRLLRALSFGRLTVVWESTRERPTRVPTEDLIRDRPMVHNHGPSEGRGLDCGEYRTAHGTLRGHCLDAGATL